MTHTRSCRLTGHLEELDDEDSEFDRTFINDPNCEQMKFQVGDKGVCISRDFILTLGDPEDKIEYAHALLLLSVFDPKNGARLLNVASYNGSKEREKKQKPKETYHKRILKIKRDKPSTDEEILRDLAFELQAIELAEENGQEGKFHNKRKAQIIKRAKKLKERISAKKKNK